MKMRGAGSDLVGHDKARIKTGDGLTSCGKNENQIREKNKFNKEQEHHRQNAKLNFSLKFQQDPYNHGGHRTPSLI
jgi:hypothetical protein